MTATPWHLGRLAVLDTETTGLESARGDRVIELAVVLFEGGVVTERWSTLLDPGRRVPPEVVKITGITDADVAGQPTFGDVAQIVLRLLEGRIAVAYNADFDRGFLVQEFARLRLQLPPTLQWLDPLVFAREIHKGQGAMKLGLVAKRLGIELEEAHRAAADAEAAGRVLLALASALPADLADTLDLQDKLLARQDAERAGWRGRDRGRGTSVLVVETLGPVNALGAAYPMGDELDPVRYMFLRAAGRG
ncbi:MAG: 3'-5' exonuclease [Myxococcales bacterium]|nr:3'-5' exonuclease [Myxococcales bacterium]